MSMESQTELAPRRIPIQERGEKRVAGLLQAAASIFAEVGFEAATMRDIAERAGASIGSLYQFFPNKDVVARAVKTQYCQELKELWASLVAVSAKTTMSQLVNQFQCDNQGHRGAPCHHPAHGRATFDKSRSGYKGVAAATARRIVSYAEASDGADQGASLRGNHSSDGEGIVVDLCRDRTFRARSARCRDEVCAGKLSVAAPGIIRSCAAQRALRDSRGGGIC